MFPPFILLNQLNRQEENVITIRKRRYVRDTADPFQWPDRRFIEVFRLSKEVTLRLIERLTPHLYVRTRPHGVSIEIIVLATLRFYATGCYQRSVGQDFNCGLSQTSVHRCVRTVTTAIDEHLSHQYIKFPTTFRERQQIKVNFMNQWGFPGTIGAIDCSHIAILKPFAEEHNFINRKGFHSLNVQMICDHDLKIRNINANYGGSTHDSFVWRNSEINVYLNNLRLNERNTWLIGDSGYPLQPYLFTPIANAQPESPEQAYNEAHARARNIIERCFGVLKMRFRCLLKERVARYSPDFVASLVVSCATLHNICIENGIPLLDQNVLDDHEDNNDVVLNRNHVNNLHREGEELRRQIVERYF